MAKYSTIINIQRWRYPSIDIKSKDDRKWASCQEIDGRGKPSTTLELWDLSMPPFNLILQKNTEV